MTLTTIILSVILIYFLLKKDKLKIKYVKLITLLSVIEVIMLNGYFIGFENKGVSVKFFLDILVGIVSIYYIYKGKIKINKFLFFWIISLLICILLGIFSEVIVPYDKPIVNYVSEGNWDGYVLGRMNKAMINISWSNVFLLYFKILVYCLVVFIVKTTFVKADIIYILNNIIKVGRFIIYYGYVEYFIKNILNQIDIISNFNVILIGLSGQISSSSDSYRLIGITAEPSYFILSIFTLLIFNLIANEIKKENRFIHIVTYKDFEVLLALFLLYLSGGFSFAWYLFIFIIVYFILNQKKYIVSWKKIFKITIVGIFFLGIFIYIINYITSLGGDTNSFANRMANAIEVVNYLWEYGIAIDSNLIEETSNVARLTSIYDVFNDFLNRPILGLGIGIQSAYSGVVTMLSEFGILGCYILYKIVTFKVNKHIKYDYVLLGCYFIIANIPIGVKSIGYEIFSIILIEVTRFYREKSEEN